MRRKKKMRTLVDKAWALLKELQSFKGSGILTSKKVPSLFDENGDVYPKDSLMKSLG